MYDGIAELVNDSNVRRQYTHVHLEVMGKLTNDLATKGLFPRQTFRDRGLGNRRVPAQLSLRNALGFEQMPEDVRVRIAPHLLLTRNWPDRGGRILPAGLVGLTRHSTRVGKPVSTT